MEQASHDSDFAEGNANSLIPINQLGFPRIDPTDDDYLEAEQIRANSLYDFGPFEELAKNISHHIGPMGNYDFRHLSYFRKTLHDVVAANPGMMKPGIPGLASRSVALSALQSKISAYCNTALADGFTEVEQMESALMSLIEAEKASIDQRVEVIQKVMASPGSTTQLLAGMIGAKYNSWKNGSKDPETYRKRRELRELQLSEDMEALRNISKEMRTKVGTKQWEESEGRKKLAEAQRYFKSIERLVSQSPILLNERAVKSEWEEVNKHFEEISSNAVSEGFKADAMAFSDRLSSFIKLALEKIGFRKPARTAGSTPRV